MDALALDVLGHIGYVFIALGMLLLGRKNRWGWVCRFLGEGGWIWLGWMLSLSSIWFWGVLFIVFDAYGFWKWSTSNETITVSPST